MRSGTAIVMAAIAVSTPAAAEDRIVDTGDVQAVAALLREAGYKAEIKKDKKGAAYIVSGANGNEFQMLFYGCENDTACGSYDFYSWYKKEPLFTPQFANDWNAANRFLTVTIDADGDLAEYLYVTATGKTTYANFVDGIEWYAAMDGKLASFIKERRDAAAPAKAATVKK